MLIKYKLLLSEISIVLLTAVILKTISMTDHTIEDEMTARYRELIKSQFKPGAIVHRFDGTGKYHGSRSSIFFAFYTPTANQLKVHKSISKYSEFN